jgi:Fur family peroxide stress response transcriptional regulator
MQRNSRQRETILNYLKKTTVHPTAEMVYEAVKKEVPNISKGTVYRNLKLLQASGQISELNIRGTITRYEGRNIKHYHFRCEGCGRVFDLNVPINRNLDRSIAARTGFKVTHHQLEFRGLCKDCLKNVDKKEEVNNGH